MFLESLNKAMTRYRQFGEEFDSNNCHSAAILPEIETDDPFQIELTPQLSTYPTNFNKFKIFFLPRTSLERYLFFLIILLIILFIVIIMHISNRQQNSKHSLCLTPSCIRMSDAIFSGMDQSVDPCDNFHEFVCGQWMRTHINPKDYSKYSVHTELAKKNLLILKSILEQTSITSLDDAEKQAIRYYRSCMNTTRLEHLHIRPLGDFFQDVLNFTLDRWIYLNKTQTYQQLFMNLIGIFSNNYEFPTILPIRIDSDEKNSTWNNIHVCSLMKKIKNKKENRKENEFHRYILFTIFEDQTTYTWPQKSRLLH